MCANAHASDALAAGGPVKKAAVAARSSKKNAPKVATPKDDGKNGTLLTGYSGSLGVH